MDFLDVGEEEEEEASTPVAEEATDQTVASALQTSVDKKSQKKKRPPAVVLRDDSSSSTSTSPDSQVDTSDEEYGEDGRARNRGKAGRKVERVAKETTSSSLANSYHEIFDAQMPPERAKSVLEEDQEQWEPDLHERLQEQLQLDQQGTATDYLTKKLLYDSLRYQKERQKKGGDASLAAESPGSRSPSHRSNQYQGQANPRGLHSGDGQALPSSSGSAGQSKLAPLDPSFLLDVENDARHLATSLDSLVESLAGTMHVCICGNID
jgi:hypothetical protein